MWHLGTWVSSGLGSTGEQLDSILESFSNPNNSVILQNKHWAGPELWYLCCGLCHRNRSIISWEGPIWFLFMPQHMLHRRWKIPVKTVQAPLSLERLHLAAKQSRENFHDETGVPPSLQPLAQQVKCPWSRVVGGTLAYKSTQLLHNQSHFALNCFGLSLCCLEGSGVCLEAQLGPSAPVLFPVVLFPCLYLLLPPAPFPWTSSSPWTPRAPQLPPLASSEKSVKRILPFHSRTRYLGRLRSKKPLLRCCGCSLCRDYWINEQPW